MASQEQAPNPRSNVLPPYVPYRSFINFIESLKQGIPARIDRSMMPNMSGGLQSQLTHALRVLLLIGHTGQPTSTLSRLVNSEGAEHTKVMHEIVTTCYQFVFLNIDIKTATPSLLEEQFARTGASGGTLDKCILFFLAAAKDGGVELSPHLKRSRGPRVQRMRPRNGRTLEIAAMADDGSRINDEMGAEMPWKQMLLSKFPSFDPSWSAEVQAKWFDAFDKLMKQGESES